MKKIVGATFALGILTALPAYAQPGGGLALQNPVPSKTIFVHDWDGDGGWAGTIAGVATTAGDRMVAGATEAVGVVVGAGIIVGAAITAGGRTANGAAVITAGDRAVGGAEASPWLV